MKVLDSLILLVIATVAEANKLVGEGQYKGSYDAYEDEFGDGDFETPKFLLASALSKFRSYGYPNSHYNSFLVNSISNPTNTYDLPGNNFEDNDAYFSPQPSDLSLQTYLPPDSDVTSHQFRSQLPLECCSFSPVASSSYSPQSEYAHQGFQSSHPSQPLSFEPRTITEAMHSFDSAEPQQEYREEESQDFSHRSIDVEEKKYEQKMPYEFEYGVNDAPSGNKYGQRESSDGNVVKGEYRVLLPDGRLQIVTYTADSVNGYQAKVSYEGEAVFPPPPYNSYNPPKEQLSKELATQEQQPHSTFTEVEEPQSFNPSQQLTYVTPQQTYSLPDNHNHQPNSIIIQVDSSKDFIPSQEHTFVTPQQTFSIPHHQGHDVAQEEYSQPIVREVFEQDYNPRYKRVENSDPSSQEPQILLNLQLPENEFIPSPNEVTEKVIPRRKPSSIFIIRKAILSQHSESEEDPSLPNTLQRTFSPPHLHPQVPNEEENYAR